MSSIELKKYSKLTPDDEDEGNIDLDIDLYQEDDDSAILGGFDFSLAEAELMSTLENHKKRLRGRRKKCICSFVGAGVLLATLFLHLSRGQLPPRLYLTCDSDFMPCYWEFVNERNSKSPLQSCINKMRNDSNLDENTNSFYSKNPNTHLAPPIQPICNLECALKKALESKNRRQICDTLDYFLGHVGMNGIFQVVVEKELIFRMDIGHILGQWFIQNANTHTDLKEIEDAYKMPTATATAMNDCSLGEEIYSFVHSSSWSSAVSLDTADKSQIWDHVFQFVESYAGKIPIDVFSHALHGMGHGALFIAASQSDDAIHEIIQGDVCTDAGDYDMSIEFTESQLETALDICSGGTMEMNYMCASGLFMTYWTAKQMKTGYFNKQDFDFSYVSTCHQFPYPAACYRWTFRYATDEQIEETWKKDPCNSAEGGEFLSEVQRRGCIWGLATNIYTVYDKSYFEQQRLEGVADAEIFSLVSYCDVYTKSGRESWKKDWLVCIAASMEAIAFDGVPNEMLPRRHCSQIYKHYKSDRELGKIVAKEGEKMCVDVALTHYNQEWDWRAYKNRIAEITGNNKCAVDGSLCLHGWRVDVLE